MALTRAQFNRLGAAATAAAITGGRWARAADAKHYSFGYDQPRTTGYGVAHNLDPALVDKIKEAFFTFPWEGSTLKA